MRTILARFAGVAALAVVVAGCATGVERRVEAGLTDAGIPTRIASCMAEIWADDLSVGQIRGLARFADTVRGEGKGLTVNRLIDHVRDWNDPRALGVVTSSAALCAVR